MFKLKANLFYNRLGADMRVGVIIYIARRFDIPC